MKKSVIAAALLAVCGAASAQGYAGALIGLSKISTDCASIASCDDTDTGYKVFAGYQVMPNVAIELGYTDFGKARASLGSVHEEIEASAISVVGAFRVPFSEDFIGVARLGLAGVKAKRTPSLSGESESNLKLYTGLGLEYQVSDAFKLSAAIDLTSAEVEGDSGAVYLIGVGAQAGF